ASVGLNGTTGVIAFDSTVSAQDVYWQASNSNLTIKIRNDVADSITINGDLTSNAWGVASAITQLKFSDGSSVNLGQQAAGQGTPLTFTYLGNTSNYFIVGSSFGSNVYEVTTNGTVNFVDNSAVGGTNTIKFSRGAGATSVTLNSGHGIVQLANGIAPSD